MRFEEIYELRTEKRLTIEEAVKMLCVCEGASWEGHEFSDILSFRI